MTDQWSILTNLQFRFFLRRPPLFDRIFLIDIVIGSFCQIWTNVSHSDFMNRPRKRQIFIFTMNRFKWFLHIQIKYTCAIKDWPALKVTIYFPIFYWVKTSENTLFFSLHFTWLYDSWNHQRVLEKWPFWKYDSWLPSETSKITSARNRLNLPLNCWFLHANVVFWLCYGSKKWPKNHIDTIQNTFCRNDSY